MKVLITDGLGSEAISTLRKLHEVDVQELDSKGLLSAIPEYHDLIVRSRTTVSKPVLTRATNLKVVGRAGVGVDNIDVAEATARKIVVVNAPTASPISVAELALGHIISLLRHLTEADRSVKDGKWEKKKFEGRELFGKTLGLVGSGRIGAEVAKRAEAFGMRVIAYDPYLSPPTAKALGIELVDKDVVFREADVVSVHAALTPETKGMIAAAEFAQMKPGAILVNCARAEIVEEAALVDALRSARLAGAAADVFQTEPPVGSPLLSAPNAVSNASAWRARSASFRTSERELWPVNGSLRGLAEPQEVSEDVGPELGVLNLRMELQSEQRPVAVPHRLDVAVLRARESHEVLGELRDFVVVGLPDLESIREPFEQDVGLVDLHDRLAELRHLGRGGVAPEILRHELVPRADPEDGSVERVEVLAVPPHLPGVHADAGRATRQHEPVEAIELRDSRVVRNDLRLDTEVLQDPPFAVGPLPPVVDDVHAHGTPVAAG